MNRQNTRKCAKLSAAASLVILGLALPVHAANLLLNPGFEFPANEGSTPTDNPTDWTYYSVGTASGLDISREMFTGGNNTPGGTYGVWLKVFEAGTQGVFQKFSDGVQPNTSYTFSGFYNLEANFDSIPDAVVDVELSFLDSSNNDLGADTATYIYASPTAQTDNASWAAGNAATFASFVSPPTGAFTQYSVTATAPANTASVVVSFDYHAANATSGSTLSAFADDGDLEGAGNPPKNAAWNADASGDWNSTGNWSTFTIPNGIGVEADFAGAITMNRNVFTDIPVTVGTLNFNNANTYVIDGAGSLTLQTGAGNAQVIVQQGKQEINLPLTLASNTVFNVSGGANLVIADPLTVNSGISLTQSGAGTVTFESTITALSGASVAFGSSSHAHALTLNSNSMASISGSGTVLQLDSLSLATGATLNIGKDEAIVDYVGASPAASIAASIKSAYASGAWTGTGITSSNASFAAGTGIGYDDNGSQVEIKFTWIGDLNLDGVVNSADLAAMGTAGGGWQHGDLNYDGVVNADDFSLFAYGAAKAGSKNINSVPEPAALGLLVGACLLRRRRA